MTNAAVYDLMAAGRLIATRKCPYFHAGIMSLVPHEAPGLGTVGTTASLLYLYDPEWVAQRTQEEMGGLAYHEWMHHVLEHFARRGDKDPLMWNIAGDLFINDQGRKMRFVFPKGGLFPELFGLPGNLTTDEYYAALLKKGEDEVEQDRGKGQKPGDWQSGKCGSGAGNPFDDEPDDSEAGGRSEAEVNQIRQRVAEAVKQHCKDNPGGRGNMPLGLDRWAETVTKPPKVPWQTVLGRVVRRAVAYRPGAVDYSYRKISRRQGGVGFGPGCPVLPAYVRPVPRVTFILDTSGSMSQAQLETSLSECGNVLLAVGAEVTFMSCDHAVHAIGKVEQPSQLARLVKGGGGSSFVPAFEELAKLRPRPEVAIFATDGAIAVPPTAPRGMQVIWLLIDVYNKDAPTLAYGERIVVSTHDDDDDE